MNKKLVLKLSSLTLPLTIGLSVVLTSTYEARAAVVSKNTSVTYFSKSNIKIINNNVFEVNGTKYNISAIANSVKDKPTNFNIRSGEYVNTSVTDEIKKVIEWIILHWAILRPKVPSQLNQYFKLDEFVKFANQFVGTSHSTEDFLNKTFSAMGMPQVANSIITNIILNALP